MALLSEGGPKGVPPSRFSFFNRMVGFCCPSRLSSTTGRPPLGPP